MCLKCISPCDYQNIHLSKGTPSCLNPWHVLGISTMWQATLYTKESPLSAEPVLLDPAGNNQNSWLQFKGLMEEIKEDLNKWRDITPASYEGGLRFEVKKLYSLSCKTLRNYF